MNQVRLPNFTKQVCLQDIRKARMIQRWFDKVKF